jgi:hypothetical protein
MFDHVLLGIIQAVRRSFERALLERLSLEERFLFDVFLGDLSWETSYSLPGEGSPPRVRADLSLDWPTWSQSSWRSWSIGEPPEDPPEVVVELVMRVQRLRETPPIPEVLSSLPLQGPELGTAVLERSNPTVEQVLSENETEWALEVAYEGSWVLDDAILEHPDQLDQTVEPLGRWVASTLVRLGDLNLEFYPREEDHQA